MQFRLSVLAIISILALLWVFRPHAATLAQVLPPVRPAQPVAAAPNTTYRIYMPLILNNAPTPAKKGMNLVYGATDCQVVTFLKAAWQYSWQPNPANCPGVENIPMISVPAEINSTLGGNSQWILTFNEPDESFSPAYMTPAQGAQYWRQIEQKYPPSSGKKLVSPATGSEDYTTWLAQFRQSYIDQYGTPPRMDALAAHCLKWWASQSINDCAGGYINKANAWGVPEVWVTEFAFAMDPSCGAGASLDQAAQMELEFLNWMNAQPKVTRYAWYTSRLQPGTGYWPQCFSTPLVDYYTPTQLTNFGTVYLPFR